VKYIELTRGRKAIVDDENFEWLNQWKWNAYGDRYAARAPGPRKKQKLILMHRLIISTPDDMYTDHINGNGFDNRKINLRICTQSQNGGNSRLSRANKTGYKGVYYSKPRKKWVAFIRVKRELIYLGYHLTKEEAAAKYNQASKKYFGEFGYLNAI
jgi:hypothetical protein